MNDGRELDRDTPSPVESEFDRVALSSKRKQPPVGRLRTAARDEIPEKSSVCRRQLASGRVFCERDADYSIVKFSPVVETTSKEIETRRGDPRERGSRARGSVQIARPVIAGRFKDSVAL